MNVGTHERIMAVALEDCIRCAERKIEACLAERTDLKSRIASLDEKIAYQTEVKRRYERELNSLMPERDSAMRKQKMLDDLVAQRAAITCKIQELGCA